MLVSNPQTLVLVSKSQTVERDVGEQNPNPDVSEKTQTLFTAN